jgi:ABC-type antimicrobial peptide transport system permease subunit
VTPHIKNHHVINTIGLAVGIACALLIMLWVEDEMKYDSFHKDSDRICRILVEENSMKGYTNSAMTMRPLAESLVGKLPEIEKAANFEMDWDVVVKSGVDYIEEDGLAVAGTSFFDIFSFPFVAGNPQLFKTEKYAVIISEKIAKKYFGNENAIGKQLEIDKIQVKVVAILKDIDYNSHIRFNLVIPEELGRDMFGIKKGAAWDNQNLYTYILAAKNASFENLSAKLHNYIPTNVDPQNKMKLLLQPLKDIHFQKDLADEDYTYLGDKRYVYIFSFMGLFILVLACINYINLSTAVSEKDIKNNGVRKILGAKKSALIKTSVTHSMVLATTATFVALIIVVIILPGVNTFAHKYLMLNFGNPLHIFFLLSVILFTGTLSGLYPAFYLASFSPLRSLKAHREKVNQWKRNGLVVFQFSLSIILIIATLVSFKQLSYIQQLNLGFDKKNTLYFHLETDKASYQSLKKKLLKVNGVEMVGGKRNFSPTVLNTTKINWQGSDGEHVFMDNQTDEDFFSLLNVKFIEGQNFSRNLQNDQAVIINKKARELIQTDNVIGLNMKIYGTSREVIGVIDDVHFRSVNEKIQPEYYVYSESPDYIFVKYNRSSISSIQDFIKKIKVTVNTLYPESPFEYKFMDTTYANLYENDRRVGAIFFVIAILAILISCSGLFGLSSYSSEQRTKEIGIRRVNGARTTEVMAMLNGDFLKWVVIAFLIACPIAWYAMNKWLENFAYKTTLSWWVFAAAGIVAMVIALLTVSWQSWRAATRNPVESLRYE